MSQILEKAAEALSLGGSGRERFRDQHELMSGTTIYVNEIAGSDSTGDGSKDKPYATAVRAVEANEAATPYIWKSQEDGYQSITTTALKKAKKGVEINAKKRMKQEAEALRAREAADAELRKLEAAKSIQIVEDKSLPAAKKLKITHAKVHRGTRVKISGWIHRLRAQSKQAFVVLRDGTGYIQCVFSGDLALAHQTRSLTLESTITVYGVVQPVPEGHSAPDGHELIVDYYAVIGLAPDGDDSFSNKVAETSDPSTLADQRHLVIRGEISSAVLRVRSAVASAFRKAYTDLGITEVTTPVMVQTQVEGGATLFSLEYYGQKAYLTQSSQLYLEAALPSLGDVFCVQESFRAENSHTRRHLSEYTHIEAELAFITFDDMLSHIEELICRTLEHVLKDPKIKELIDMLHPDFEFPARPFMRMRYSDAIDYLNKHDIHQEDGSPHSFGDDIAEAAERKMTDQINRPILLTHFPAGIKAFYMQRDKTDHKVTESVDVLMPGVGEIVGGSMRIHNQDELLAAFSREGIDPAPYYW